MKNAPRSNTLGSNSLATRLSAATLAATSMNVAIEDDAKAAEITTATHEDIMVCFGSSSGGDYRTMRLSIKAITENGNTKLELTEKQNSNGIFGSTGIHPGDYVARIFRDNVYGRTHAQWLMDQINKNPFSGASFSVSKVDFPNFYIKTDNVYFIEGPSFDQDRLIIIGENYIEIYAPYKVNGELKQEYYNNGNGKPQPLITFKPKVPIVASKIIGGVIYAMQEVEDWKYQLTLYSFNNDKITEGQVVPLPANITPWNMGRKAEMVCGESPTKKSKHLIVQTIDKFDDQDGVMTIDLSDLSKTKNYPGVYDMVSVDPEGRYQFRSMLSDKLVIVDGFTGASKEVLSTENYPSVNGYIVYTPGTKNPTFYFLDKEGKSKEKIPARVVRIELVNPATLETKISYAPLQMFEKEFAFNAKQYVGGADCVPYPNAKSTIQVTGGTPEPQPEAAEVEPQPDTIDSTDGDTGSETVAEAVPIEDQPDATITQDTDTAPDVLGEVITPDVQQDTKPDTNEPDVVAGDTDGGGEGDMSVQPDLQPEMTALDAAQPETQPGSDTQTSQETPTGVQADAGSNDTSVASKPPPPKNNDDSCTTSRVPSENNLLATGVLIAGAAYAIRRRRRQFSMIEK
jgi:hypothetical protein